MVLQQDSGYFLHQQHWHSFAPTRPQRSINQAAGFRINTHLTAARRSDPVSFKVLRTAKTIAWLSRSEPCTAVLHPPTAVTASPLQHSPCPPPHKKKKKKLPPETLHTNYSAAPSGYRAPPDLRHSPPVEAISHGVGSHLAERWSSRQSVEKNDGRTAEVCEAPPGAARATAAAPAAAAAAATAASQAEGGSAVCNVSFGSLPPVRLPPHPHPHPQPILSSAPASSTHFLLTHTFAAICNGTFNTNRQLFKLHYMQHLEEQSWLETQRKALIYGTGLVLSTMDKG